MLYQKLVSVILRNFYHLKCKSKKNASEFKLYKTTLSNELAHCLVILRYKDKEFPVMLKVQDIVLDENNKKFKVIFDANNHNNLTDRLEILASDEITNMSFGQKRRWLNIINYKKVKVFGLDSQTFNFFNLSGLGNYPEIMNYDKSIEIKLDDTKSIDLFGGLNVSNSSSTHLSRETLTFQLNIGNNFPNDSIVGDIIKDILNAQYLPTQSKLNELSEKFNKDISEKYFESGFIDNNGIKLSRGHV